MKWQRTKVIVTAHFMVYKLPINKNLGKEESKTELGLKLAVSTLHRTKNNHYRHISTHHLKPGMLLLLFKTVKGKVYAHLILIWYIR